MKNCYSCNHGCRPMNERCSNMSLAMAYVRPQRFNTLYEPMKALHNGTAFPELNLIFCGRRDR